MTNEELLAKIREEIERLKKNNEVSDDSEHAPYELDVACGYDMACDDFLSFLSALEEHTKGYDESYIQSKIAKASETWRGVDVDEYLSQVRGEVHNPIFDECVAKVDPKVREEVRENIELEEEIKRYWKEEMPVVLESDLNDIALHFAQWGAEHLKK